MPDPTRRSLLIGIDHDLDGVESDAIVNQSWVHELRERGHRFTGSGDSPERGVDVQIHHSFRTVFSDIDFSEPVPHVAVRTWDFGPHPTEWVELINRHCAQLWVHTEWIRAHALEAGVDERKVRVVPHGIDPGVFRPDGPVHPVPTEKRFRFLFVGGAIERKGIDILLGAYASAFSRDDDVSLIVKDHSRNFFYQQTSARKGVVDFVADPGAPELVHLDEHLSAEDLAALYRACDVGIWPYRAEGFLIPALECLACGTPTMIPEIGPTADFSDASTSFLVPVVNLRLPYRRSFRLRLDFDVHVEAINIIETNPDVLAAAMRSAYESDPQVLADKGASGAARAHGGFTWADAADTIEQCLAELVPDAGVDP